MRQQQSRGTKLRTTDRAPLAAVSKDQSAERAVARPPVAAGRSSLLGALALLVLTAAIYFPVVQAGFLWDDDGYVTRSPLLETRAGLFDIWFRLGATTMYAPATFTTFWLGYQLWGLQPFGYHLVNWLLHAVCVVLLWRLLERLRLPGAWIAAALFAVHPVMVESVAWIAELKNMQSGVFALLSMLAFLQFRPLEGGASSLEGGARRGACALSLVLFALALLSKAMVVAVPPVLLALVWWRHGRLTRSDFVVVTPMLAMGLVAGLLTIHVEQQFSGATGAGYALTMAERTLVAGRALWFYVGKLLWPFGLLSVYPRWRVSAADVGQLVYPLAALGLVVTLWLLRHRIGRGPLTAALCFGLLLSPLVGFFNVAYFMYSFVADHFQYHAAPALLALVAVGLARLRDWQSGRLARAVGVATAALLLGLALLAFRHVPSYRDEKTRCRQTIAGNPEAWSAMYNLGVALKAEGNAREALHWYREALRVTPTNPEVLNNAGVALTSLGEHAEAIRHYREALRIWPDYALAHNNLGTALAALGDREAAIRELSEAVRLRPSYTEARANLAQLFAAAGRFDAAEREYRELLTQRPDDLVVRRGLAATLLEAGRADAAIASFTELLKENPDDAEIHNALAMAQVQAGRLDEAERELETALRIKPGFAAARNNLGTLYASRGRRTAAIAEYQRAVELEPTYADALANLGSALAVEGRLGEALAAYRAAVAAEPKSADYRERLGVLLAESGAFDEAIAEFERALVLDPGHHGAQEDLELARRQRAAAVPRR